MKSIDIHTHGIGGFDTRNSTADDILRIAEIHGASGVTEIVLSIYPDSIQEMRQQIKLVKEAMERQGPGPRVQGPVGNTHGSDGSDHTAKAAIRDHGVVSLENSGPGTHAPGPDAGAARILGVHLEGPFLNPIHCGALDPSFFVDPEERTFHELMNGFQDMIRVITVAPELSGACAFIRKISDLGIIVSMGHSDATFAEAEAGFNAGARGITHLFNGMRGFHHREPGLTGFGLLNKQIYVEVIADPFHLHVATLDLVFKTKEPERIILVSDSVKESKAGGDGRIAAASGRLQGGSMTITESARRLVDLGFDKDVVTNAITANPRRHLILSS